MIFRTHNAPDAPPASGCYAQAVEVTGVSRLLVVSGQIPVDAAGAVPETFPEQALLAWANVAAQLRVAGMAMTDLARVTNFLSDRRFALENRLARQAALGGHALEIEAIAAR